MRDSGNMSTRMSTHRSTRVIPTLSAASTLTRIESDTVPPVGDAIDTVGGIMSGPYVVPGLGPFDMFKAIAVDTVEFPAASYATAVNATAPSDTVVESHVN